MAFFLTLPCVMPTLGGNPSEFLDETYPAKTRGMGLPYSPSESDETGKKLLQARYYHCRYLV